ncbi:MAG: TIGR01777 family protein [Gemmatimonadales bacterium]|nr:TIGR01777 family protein [Gemmatimonadales bacterium]
MSAPPIRLRKIAITGVSGFLGSLLAKSLSSAGHEVVRIVRREPRESEIRWDPAGTGFAADALRGIDAVVHLAGESIAGGRWSPARKERILESRRRGTRLLTRALAETKDGPRILVSASAIGYYGNRGEELVDEKSPPGQGFLPEVCRVWEEETEPAEEAGVRVARIRIGLVQTPAGGMLERILLPFRFGLGAQLGTGRQWMSWISGFDLIRIFSHALTDDRMRGPINAVAPNPIRNAEYTETLGRVLHRPTPFAIPASLLRLGLGDLADEALLASTKVAPRALTESGFAFEKPMLEEALKHALGKT